jgi:5-methylcytosine-specific restriction endonuclease McrA
MTMTQNKWRLRFIALSNERFEHKARRDAMNAMSEQIKQINAPKWEDFFDESRDDVGTDGAQAQFYRYSSGSTHGYRDDAKYVFVEVDSYGRKRYLTAQECDERGFNYMGDESFGGKFSKNLNEPLYRQFKKAYEENRADAFERYREACEKHNLMKYGPVPNRPERSFSERWWELYNLYLASPEWNSKKIRVRARDYGRCQLCNSDRFLDIHHLTYNRVGDEALFDLVTLCRNCHDEEEALKKESKNEY